MSGLISSSILYLYMHNVNEKVCVVISLICFLSSLYRVYAKPSRKAHMWLGWPRLSCMANLQIRNCFLHQLISPNANIKGLYLLLSNSQTINCFDEIFILFYWFLKTNSIHRPFFQICSSKMKASG
jgi:hypothetical protein